MKKKCSVLITIALMLMASALTFLVLAIVYNLPIGMTGSDNIRVGREFTELLWRIENTYIGEYDLDDVAAAAMRAAVDALGDTWSHYLTADEYADYLVSSNNQFTGIGVRVLIDEETGGMDVQYIYKGSPAETAGIMPGDVITSIDGNSLSGLDLAEMGRLLTREIGETALLTVIRIDGSVEMITVGYELIFTDPVSFEMLDGNIGYVSLANFEGGSADGFIAAVNDLIAQGAEGVVFDVRGNPGGMVNETTQILDYLLPEGEIFISVSKDGSETITYSGPEMVEIPAVVIVDRYSFSAAEFFAAMLKEYDYAEVVGEQTTGKSRSQMTLVLPNGGALRISTHQYLTKNRVALYEVGGLSPDYPCVLTDDEFNMLLSGTLDKNDDPQLQLALSVLLGTGSHRNNFKKRLTIP